MVLTIGQVLQKQKVTLRPFQGEAVQATYDLINAGCKNILFVGPTGAGKTVMGAKLLNDFVTLQGKRCMFLVHREKLVAQTSDKLVKFGLDHGFIKAGKWKEDFDSPVQLGSVQTLVRRKKWRDELTGDKGIHYIFFDECHETAWSSSWELLHDLYPEAVFIGLTGSPWRLNRKQEMGDKFDDVVIASTPGELITKRWLVPHRIFSISSADLKSVGISKGDYDEEDLEFVCNRPQLIDKLVEEYKRLAVGRRAIAFCVSVAHCEAVAEAFNQAGIPAAAISASTTGRDKLYDAHARGDIMVLVSCNVLTAGHDEPLVGCVILARPTKSCAMYHQQIGRGLRIVVGPDGCWAVDANGDYVKEDCIVIDQAGNRVRFGAPDELQREAMGLYEPKPEPKQKRDLGGGGGAGAPVMMEEWELDLKPQQIGDLEEWVNDPVWEPHEVNLNAEELKTIKGLLQVGRMRKMKKHWVADNFMVKHPDFEGKSLHYLAKRLGYAAGWAGRIIGRRKKGQWSPPKPQGLASNKVWQGALAAMPKPVARIAKQHVRVAAITPVFNQPTRFVLQVADPVWKEWAQESDTHKVIEKAVSISHGGDIVVEVK